MAKKEIRTLKMFFDAVIAFYSRLLPACILSRHQINLLLPNFEVKWFYNEKRAS